MNLLQRLVLAEAANQGDIGMALVARSVLNRQGIINAGSSPGTFNSKSGSLTDIIYGSGQYQPISDGSINRKFSDDWFTPRHDKLTINMKKVYSLFK